MVENFLKWITDMSPQIQQTQGTTHILSAYGHVISKAQKVK